MIGFNQNMFLTELMYMLAMAIFCFGVYYKTKKVHNLTNHKGVKYFRAAFVYFGLAYITRFLVFLGVASLRFFENVVSFRMIQPLSLTIMAYFSTMAIFFMLYSLFWKNLEETKFLMTSNTLAFLLSLLCFVTRTHRTLFILQMFLFLFLSLIVTTNKKKKKFSNLKILYLLTSIFWIINLILLDLKFMRNYKFIWALQGVSILVLTSIYYKLHKMIT